MDPGQNQNHTRALDAMLSASKPMQTLSDPLWRHFKINGCVYQRVYETGESLTINNSRDFVEANFTRHHEVCDPFTVIKHVSLYEQQGFYLLANEPTILARYTSIIRSLWQAFDFCHALVSLERIHTAKGRALELVLYLAPESQKDINRFYLNHLDLFKRYNRHLRECLDPVIDTLPLMQALPSEAETLTQLFQSDNAKENAIISQFVKETRCYYPKYNELEKINVSAREREAMLWYIRGKSTAETADILGIGATSVQSYVDRLKQKLSCYYKQQLLLKLIDSGLITPDDWRDIYRS